MKIIKNNKGTTLVEVMISLSLLAVIFTMFAFTISAGLKTYALLYERKTSREKAYKNIELMLGSNNASAPSIVGSLEVILDVPEDIENKMNNYSSNKFSCDIVRTYYSSGTDSGYLYTFIEN